MSHDTPLFSTEEWQARARRLRRLHEGPDVLVLLNPWDRFSALLFASVPGCQALASTSAGISATLGYPDGEHVPIDEMLAVVRQIAAAVDVPVTVDFEAGYAATPAQLAENVRRVVAAGAVGINLEDGIANGSANETLRDPAEQAERLDAAREALQVGGVPGVLNARTDVLLHQHGPRESWLPEAIERGLKYAAHGADCIYVPGLPIAGQSPDEARRDIALLVRELGCPVNLLAQAALPPVAVLRDLGVRRVSTGSSLLRLIYATARDTSTQILASSEFEALALANTLPLGAVNRMLDSTPA